MRPPYRGVLFDLDGTLVDSLKLILASYRHTMARHLGRVPPDEAWLRTLGTPLRIQLQAFARSPDELEAMFQTYLTHNQSNHDRLVRTFPGMREAVDALRRRGYRLAVVTSKLRDNAIRELRTCGLEDCFEEMVSADDVEHPKPHPQPVQLALERLRIDAADALMVGDSIHDLHAGRAAGAATAAALWGPFGREQLAEAEPDHWLEDVTALLALLDGGAEVASA